MNDLLPLLPVLGYVVIDAHAQGRLNLLTRQYVPPTEQKAVNLPLHGLYPLCFGCLLALAAVTCGVHWIAVGILLRLALFDPILNATKGDAPFAVGTSALTDKLIRKAGGSRAELVSCALRVAAVVLCGLTLYFFDA